MRVDFSGFDGAIFDFDETMIDLEVQHHAAYAGLCHAMGNDFNEMPASFRFSSGMRIVDEIATMKEKFGWTDSLEALLDQRTRIFLDELRHGELQWLPGVEDVVRALRARGRKLAIASSGTRAYIEEILQRLGLRDAFDTIVAGEQVTTAKPDPEAFLRAAALLGISPARCCVFEDSAVGVRAAKNAGMFCIAVRNRDAFTPQDLSPADVVVESMAEVTLSF